MMIITGRAQELVYLAVTPEGIKIKPVGDLVSLDAVETLVNENRNEGQYQEEWDAVGMTSGIYILHLKAGERIETQKLLLQK